MLNLLIIRIIKDCFDVGYITEVMNLVKAGLYVHRV